MSKTTKITFAPDDGIGGQVTQRHHHVQTDEDLDPPHVPNSSYPSHHGHSHPCHSNPSPSSRTINGYLLMERLEKLEIGQDKLSSVIVDLRSSINELNLKLINASSSSKESLLLGPKKCHKSISTQSDTGVQTEEKLPAMSDIREKEKEINRLRKELLKLRSRSSSHSESHSQQQQQKTASSASAPKKNEDESEVRPPEAYDYESESPLNLFIECFKKKYDVAVHPNDVAIFV